MRSLLTRLAAATALLASLLLTGATTPATAAASSGLNDWTCRPSSAHPRPVVLWHGLGSNKDVNMGLLGQTLAQQGYCVFSKTYGTTYYGPFTGGLASMRTSAAELRDFVNQVRATTGAAEVDIVGHSEGTTVPAYYLKFLNGSAAVKTFVGFGSNFQGTSLNGLQTLSELTGFRYILDAGGCIACNEFAPGSSFMTDLDAGGVTVAGVDYTSIVSKYDTVVTPYTSGILAPADNVTNVVLQDVCPADFSGHVGQAVDPNVFAIVSNALDPANAKPVSCVPMPWFG